MTFSFSALRSSLAFSPDRIAMWLQSLSLQFARWRSSPAVAAPMPAELGPAGHAAKVAAHSPEAMGHCEAIHGLQSSAARQVDAAGYALSRMAAELRTIMAVPAPAPARVASVHKLEPLVRPGREEFWQKVAAA